VTVKLGPLVLLPIHIVLAITSPFDIQSDILNYLVQESLAHAALIFATLAAAFAFATGFRPRIVSWKRKLHCSFYFVVLFVLFIVAVYAFFRFVYYAQLTSYLLNRAQPPSQNDTLSSYWRNSVKVPADATGAAWSIFSGLHFEYGWGGWVGVVFAIIVALFVSLAMLCIARQEEDCPKT
jgi:hypothetical protein